MKTLVVCGGTAPSFDMLKAEIEDSDSIICADSGGNYLYKHKIIPDYLIGDFDSINPMALEYFSISSKCNITKYPKDKDFTDAYLALQKAIEIGSDKIVFLGCTGTRIDHMLGNLAILKVCMDNNITAFIKDEHNTIYITNKSIKLKGYIGQYFSLQAYGSLVRNLYVENAKFELHGYDLSPYDSLTISNEFLDSDVKISFDCGILLIITSKD